MGQERVGHVLVEEGCRADEVERYPIWAISCKRVSEKAWRFEQKNCGYIIGRSEKGLELIGVLSRGGGGTDIFIASSCSFLGIISSICGARRG